MLRLVPGIGAFITVSVKMGKHLLHFSIVYLSILLPFSLAFYIFNSADFQSFSDAMFSTFRIIFGHGSAEAFYKLDFTKLVYTVYILLTVLLMLNLIIGVMSNTVNAVMAQREVTRQQEILKEAIGVEFTWACLEFMRLERVWNGYVPGSIGSADRKGPLSSYFTERVDKKGQRRLLVEVSPSPM